MSAARRTASSLRARCRRPWRAPPTAAPVRRAVPRADGELEIVVSTPAADHVWQTTSTLCRASVHHDAPVQHPDPHRGAVRARPGRHRADVHLRPHRLRARAHRQLPDLRLRGRAAAHAAVPARLPGAAGDELHRRRRPHDRRRAEGRAWICAPTPISTSRRSARTRARSGSKTVEEMPRATDEANLQAMADLDRRARPQRPHLSQRRLDLLQDLDAARATAGWRASITTA